MEKKGESDHFLEILENLDILEILKILEIPQVKDPFRNDPFSGPDFQKMKSPQNPFKITNNSQGC